MNLNFEFRHNNLSVVELHKKGIRSTKLLEEVILGESFWDNSVKSDESLYYATGFTSEMNALVVVFRIDSDLRIITLDVNRATIDEVKNYYCKFC